MKKAILLAVLAVASVFTVSCGKPKQILHIYSWGDYYADSVIKKFEKEFNCSVRIDVYDSNEAMYAKLKAGASGYDIVVPSSYMAETMEKQGMLCRMDHSKLPNVLKNFDKTYQAQMLDQKLEYTIPYFASFTGIGYHVDKVKNFKPSWSMFERTDLQKRCSLLNDMREVLGAALCVAGKSVNSTDPKALDAAVKQSLVWKKHIAKFEVDDAKRAIAAGEFNMIQTYNGDMLQVYAENPKIHFIIPEEGSTCTFDNFAILKTSENPELAYQFINFIYRPDICAENMNEIRYITPNTEALKLVDEDLRNNPAFNFPPEVRARCQVLRDLGEQNKLYIKAWEKIRQE